MKYLLKELFDFNKLKKLLDSFCNVHGISVSIGDLDGTRLISSCDTKLCLDFHRKNIESKKNCNLSRIKLINGILSGKKHVLYKCKNGLWDAAAPIKINNEHVAYFYIGQFLLEQPDKEYFRRQAFKFGYDEEFYIAALDDVPILKKENIIKILDFVTNFVGLLGELGLRNIKQLKFTEILQKSEKRFKMVLDSMDAIVYVVDIKTYEVLFINEYTKKIFGDVVGKVCWRSLQKNKEKPCKNCPNDKIIDVNGKPTGVYCGEIKIQDNRWYEYRAQSIQWIDGRIVAIKIATDITKRKKIEEELKNYQEHLEEIVRKRTAELESAKELAERTSKKLEYKNIKLKDLASNNAQLNDKLELELEELKKTKVKLLSSEKNFKTLFETMDDLIFITNKKGEIIYANSSLIKKLEYSIEELKKMRIYDIFTEKDIQKTEQIYSSIFNSEKFVCSLSLKKKNNAVFPVETRIWHGEWDSKECIFGISKDLSKEQEALQKFNKLFENSPALMAVNDVDNMNFIEVNNAFLEKTGYSKDDLIGKSIKELNIFCKIEEQKKVVDELKRNDCINNHELKIRNKNGNILDGLFSGEVIESQGKKYYLTVMTDITAQKQAERKLKQQTLIDSLTGAYNRNSINDLLKEKIEDCEKNKYISACIVIDIDNYKEINDNYGHDAGDYILKIFTKRIKSLLQAPDLLIRTGGDEFLVYLHNIARDVNVGSFANKIIKKCSAPYNLSKEDKHIKINISCSLGITIFPKDGKKVEKLITNADLALYHVKNTGKNGYSFYNEYIGKREADKFLMKQKIKEAIAKNLIIPYYQPIVGKEGKIKKVEALARIYSSEEGMISPVDFIPVAEETGLIGKIGEVMLKKVLEATRYWHSKGYKINVSINISVNQLNKRFYNEVMSIINKYEIEPRFLCLEITERTLMSSSEEKISLIKRINKEGIKFSIDDFGKEYSSLSRLNQLPVNEIKIDREFLKDIVDIKKGKFNRGLIKSLIDLAKAGDLSVVIEGVETIDELKVLYGMGCDKIQGYYFSKPLSQDDLSKIIGKSYDITMGELNVCKKYK